MDANALAVAVPPVALDSAGTASSALTRFGHGMYIASLVLLYLITYAALRWLLRGVVSGFSVVCATLLLSPALFFASALLLELATGKGTGLAGIGLVVWVGLPLALVALAAMFVGALTGWVSLGLRAASGGRANRQELVCEHCGHQVSAHRLAPVDSPAVSCTVAGCSCWRSPTDDAP